ncbi:hypothetical protein GCM10025298_14780 [Natronobiforma cellulositropha]
MPPVEVDARQREQAAGDERDERADDAGGDQHDGEQRERIDHTPREGRQWESPGVGPSTSEHLVTSRTTNSILATSHRESSMTEPQLMTAALVIVVTLCLLALLYISTQWDE